MLSRNLLAGACAAAVLATACSGDEPRDRFPLREPYPSPTSSDTFVVGLVGTLSGPQSWRGEDAFEGADLGVHVLNRMRPRGSPPYELVPLDDGGDADRATALVEQLAELTTTVGVVYAGPPEGLPPAENALGRAGIPAVLCYGDLLGAGVLGPHLFQTAPSVTWEADRIAAYAANDRRYRVVGALVEDSVTGEAAERALRRSLAAAGVRASVATYDDGADMGVPLVRLRRRHVEAVVVEGSPGALTAALTELDRIDARYRSTRAARISSAPRHRRLRLLASGGWRPQPMAFDLALSSKVGHAVPGLVAAESYARGVSYLPLPAMRWFRSAFIDWWDEPPTGWESRAYDAVRMIGWAARRAGLSEDLAVVLEHLSGTRFSTLPVALGAKDHTSVDPSTIGLWVVPRPGIFVPERRRGLGPSPWVPLARSFARRDGRTSILPADVRWLFERRRTGARPPRYPAMLYGVTTPPSDPVH
jgi:ABC-type branched-subunit amino acid transport system substrate-binding protein